jgi:hypothetical protein
MRKRCWKVCHERSTKVERCYGKDEGRPLGAAFQEEAANRPRLLRLRGVVVNAGGKGVAERPRQVGLKEMSASEPLWTYRKRQTLSKPGALPTLGTSLRGT